ncbi:AMP-binding protein [Cryobacterium sp. 5B3]|uniref:AMP-binding protein n=1 Tax=unclassified Cryobacterium TaxID=2649013 RepID=UPI002AB51AA7|nr:MULTISPECIES: AMP-binding protein [unclassified Cryobacterium]MDY7542091.1 AMP-binding protein [Cryobacterium sp. 5B3]MEA9999988.1 AMP-binding protein [Cryobacterium sp. RTS3]MEB0266147.1 AMP-binding protein [Cryobacterium sp. 10I5]MEB0275470.1 AMP-binding protein [Cryobacterium sp. 5B3]
MIIASTHPDVEIPDLSVYDYLFGSITEEDREHTAMIDAATGLSTSYRELVAGIDAVAGALSARGIGIGDVVAVHAPNSTAFAIMFHGILRAGATATTINSLYGAAEIASQLRDSQARLLFTVAPFLPQASAAAELAGLAADAVALLDGDGSRLSLADLILEGHPAPVVVFDPATHVAVLPYSSGTTGRPKGVILTHRNLVANVAQAMPVLEGTADDRVLAVLPFFHIYGMTVLLNIALAARATVITMTRFDLPEFLRLIQDYRATYVFIAPPIAVALAKHPLVDDYDLSSLRTLFSGAAPLDASLAHAVADRLGCQVRQGYGMSELSPISHAMPRGRDDIPHGVVGLALPNIECKLVDPETGRDIVIPDVGVSEPGELLVRGPNVMLGYLGNEQATREILEADGFLHTGDVATVSAEGYVTIIDRLKELIKYKGYQVAPAELEALLLSHPAIADAAVVGAPDADGQEVPKAFVVVLPGQVLLPGDVMAFIAERVAPHKKVRQVAFIDVIPKSTSGKILRKDLRALAPTP